MSSPKKTKARTAASIIIPAYNQAQELKKLLTQLVFWVPKNWEVIVVDDASSDDTHRMIKKFPVQYHRLRKNQGPANARNLGAKMAKGKILVFFDADVLIFKNTPKEALRLFREDPKVAAVSGMWAKTQKSNSFFPQYKALRDWSYFFNEAENKGLYYFTPRVAAIKKSVFLKAGGFNTKFKKADLESLEFSFRLQKITSIRFNPRFLVKHQFEGALVQIKNYFKRTYFFLELFSVYRQFCRTVSTSKEAVRVLTATLSFLILLFGFLFQPILFLFPPILVLYLYQERGFLSFFFLEKGFFFTLKSFCFNCILHLVIFVALFVFSLKSPLWYLKRP